mgnify:CR=1 FL=1
MAHVHTVKGPIESLQLGVTLMHEHIFVLSPEINQNYPDSWGDEEYRVEVPLIDWHGQKFVRISVQGYNHAQDLAALTGGLKALLAEYV